MDSVVQGFLSFLAGWSSFSCCLGSLSSWLFFKPQKFENKKDEAQSEPIYSCSNHAIAIHRCSDSLNKMNWMHIPLNPHGYKYLADISQKKNKNSFFQ